VRVLQGETQERTERLRATGIALLQSSGDVEKLIESGEVSVGADGLLRLSNFKQLLDSLKLGVDAADAEKIFEIINAGGGDTMKVDELKQKVRSSALIEDMYSESFQNVALTVAVTLAFAAGLFLVRGPVSGLDFLTGYVVEDSLSVDNLFVFLALFKYFKVPPALQSFCLNLGIYGAVVLRAAFIFAGLAAVQAFRPLLLFFAAFLIYASYQTLSAGEDDDDEEEEGPPGPVMELLSKFPTTPDFDGDKLFVQSDSGAWLATPLALCIIAVELCDILFAVDSIPAVFAVTDDPLIVYTSNIAAILGLRSLYQVLAVAAQDLIYLEKAVAIILGFVGVKLAAEVAGFEVGSGLSLGVIVTVLGGGILLSLQAQGEQGGTSSAAANSGSSGSGGGGAGATVDK